MKTKTVKEFTTEQKIKEANEAIALENKAKMNEFENGYKELVERTGLCLNPIMTIKQGSVTASFEVVPVKK